MGTTGDQEKTVKREKPIVLHAPHVQEQKAAGQAPMQEQVRQHPAEMQMREARTYTRKMLTDRLGHMQAIISQRYRTLGPNTSKPREGEPPAAVQKGLSKKEKKRLKERQRTADALRSIGLVSEEGVRKLEEKASQSKSKQDKIYQEVIRGDFSNFEHLDTPLRNALASRYMRQIFTPPLPGESAESYVAELKHTGGMTALLNPLFRLGISLCMRGGFEHSKFNFASIDFFRELDSKCNAAVMLETISRRPEEMEKFSLKKKLGGNYDAALKQNLASRIVLAKQLLLAQMSEFAQVEQTGEKVEKEKIGRRIPWNSDVANAFAHCSRVSFHLPGNGDPKDLERMYASLRGISDDENDGLKDADLQKVGRTATHDIKLWGTADNPNLIKEEKRPIYRTNFDHTTQKGIDLAVGGLGNAGVGSNMLVNDGSCGHLYTLLKKGDATHFTSYMAGVESDAYSFTKTITNQLGHKHTLKATPEYASSFGGQRTDEIGSKYGGRDGNLTAFSAHDIAENLNVLETYMRRAERAGADTSGDLAKLVGKKMDRAGFQTFIGDLEAKAAGGFPPAAGH